MYYFIMIIHWCKFNSIIMIMKFYPIIMAIDWCKFNWLQESLYKLQSHTANSWNCYIIQIAVSNSTTLYFY